MRTIERIRLLPVLAGETARRLRYRWKTTNSSLIALPVAALPEQTFVPVDLEPADASLAGQFYAGVYTFDGSKVVVRDGAPFSIEGAETGWKRALHSFRWLRHLVAADTPLARAQGAALIGDWIAIDKKALHREAYEPSVVAARLIAWCCHAPALFNGASPENGLAMRRSIAQQVRFLQNVQNSLPADRTRLMTATAVLCVALCFGAREKALRAAQRDLVREINRQILADGGHVSRNPAVLVEFLARLIPIADLFANAGQVLEPAIATAIDRMKGALRFFSHTDGSLAQFNGTGVPDAALLDALLTHVGAAPFRPAQTQASAPQTGYERLSAGQTAVLVDTGAPLTRATASRAAAGTLAFEMSSGRNRFIINCGCPPKMNKRLAPYWRVTAAHSTATIGERSSSRFAATAALADALPAPIIAWPQSIGKERRAIEGFDVLEASHDGFAAETGLFHRRILQLARDGKTLNGVDRFERADPRRPLARDEEIVLRFHLPAAINASLLANGRSILLAAPDKESWVFTCVDGPLSLEESVQFAIDGPPRKTEQIVVRAPVSERPEIRWTMERQIKKPPTKTKVAANADATPDLLSVLDTVEPAE